MMDARDERVGSTVAGKYVLRRLLGWGAMGAIYEGAHVALGRRVAIKVLPATLAREADLVARFHREARAMSAVESEYIVQIFDIGEDPAIGLYMVLELLCGEDLEQRIHRERRLESVTAVTIGYQVARGLAKAHAAGVVHRDLKPANVFLTSRDDGSLVSKILDFGISKLTEVEAGPDGDGITRPGVALGTPQYMSPEQIQARTTVDGRTDVWSLSVLLYEALAGRSPFSRASYLDVLESIMKRPVPPLREAAPWVPPSLADVIMAGLERDPAARTPSAAAYAEELLHALPQPSVRASGPCASATMPTASAQLSLEDALLPRTFAACPVDDAHRMLAEDTSKTG